jgi:hypothetical protein
VKLKITTADKRGEEEKSTLAELVMHPLLFPVQPKAEKLLRHTGDKDVRIEKRFKKKNHGLFGGGPTVT